MRILVTGATGFIGRHVAQLLAARGDHVQALVRDTSDAWKTKLLTDAGVSLCQGDVTDAGSVAAAMEDVDGLVHCAAYVQIGRADPERMRAINVGGTQNVLDAALDAGVTRILHTSSIAALGVLDSGEVDEDTPHPGTYHSAYERSKHESDQYAASLAADGAPIVQALPSVVFGRKDPNFGLFFRMYMQRRIPVLPGPDTWISLVHVEDLARGMTNAFDHGRPGDRFIFNTGEIPLGDLFDLIETHTGIKAPRLTVSAGTAHAAVRMASWFNFLRPARKQIHPQAARLLGTQKHYRSDKARNDLAWQPGDLNDQLIDTARYYAIRYGPRDAAQRLTPLIPDPPRPRHAKAEAT